MNTRKQDSRNWIGLALIVLGVLFLLDTLEVFGTDNNLIGDIWPLFIIAIGFIGWAKRGFTFMLGPVVVMVIGGLLLVGTLTDSNPWKLWPALLIIVGLSFIWRQRSPLRSSSDQTVPGEGAFSASAVFGGNKQRISGEFKGGRATALMGGGELDLRDATLPPGGAVLDVNVMLGSYEVTVPGSWNVTLNADAFLRGVEDKRSKTVSGDVESNTLEITGSVFLGSLELKS
jgi:hypothetical protein